MIDETENPITIEDLKRKALEVRDLAEVEVRTLAEQQGARMALIGIVAVVAALSIAYYLGTRKR